MKIVAYYSDKIPHSKYPIVFFYLLNYVFLFPTVHLTTAIKGSNKTKYMVLYHIIS
jgi:hypothetical protein